MSADSYEHTRAIEAYFRIVEIKLKGEEAHLSTVQNEIRSERNKLTLRERSFEHLKRRLIHDADHRAQAPRSSFHRTALAIKELYCQKQAAAKAAAKVRSLTVNAGTLKSNIAQRSKNLDQINGWVIERQRAAQLKSADYELESIGESSIAAQKSKFSVRLNMRSKDKVRSCRDLRGVLECDGLEEAVAIRHLAETEHKFSDSPLSIDLQFQRNYRDGSGSPSCNPSQDRLEETPQKNGETSTVQLRYEELAENITSLVSWDNITDCGVEFIYISSVGFRFHVYLEKGHASALRFRINSDSEHNQIILQKGKTEIVSALVAAGFSIDETGVNDVGNGAQ